jgi:hypothetical protein
VWWFCEVVTKNDDFDIQLDRPPNSKIRLNATICIKILDEMKIIHAAEVQDAKNHDRPDPDWSKWLKCSSEKA